MLDHIGGKLVSIRRTSIGDNDCAMAVTLLSGSQQQMIFTLREWSEMTVLVRAIEASGGLG